MYSSNRQAGDRERGAGNQLAVGSRQLAIGSRPLQEEKNPGDLGQPPVSPKGRSAAREPVPGYQKPTSSDQKPKNRVFVIVHLLVWLMAAAPLLGQDSTSPKAAKPALVDLKQGASFEIAPHTGMMGGSGVFGLRLAMNYGSVNLEVSGEQVIGETANMYPISVNFALNLATRGRLLPYGTVGGGLFLTVPTNALGSETVSTMGINFGGGARFYITPTFGFRLEARQYVTSVANELESRDELLIFQEVSLGVTFMFR